jgi:thiol-disulfide isomerase/thioredoxin
MSVSRRLQANRPCHTDCFCFCLSFRRACGQSPALRHHEAHHRKQGPGLRPHGSKRPEIPSERPQGEKTWCTFCRAEIPHFKSLYASYAKQGLEIVNIDIQESKEKVAKFVTKNELPYRTLLDEDGTVSGVYEVRGVPTMVLVDKNGMIVCHQCRTVDTLLKTMMKK